MKQQMIKPIHVGSLPISFAMTRLANIQEAVDRAVHWREDNTNVSPGFLIETLIASIMSTQGSIHPTRSTSGVLAGPGLGATVSRHCTDTRSVE